MGYPAERDAVRCGGHGGPDSLQPQGTELLPLHGSRCLDESVRDWRLPALSVRMAARLAAVSSVRGGPRVVCGLLDAPSDDVGVGKERIPLLLLVSIGSAAYFWEVLFYLGLPAVIALAIQVARARVWLLATFLYVVVQFSILAVYETVHECVLSLLWIALYWSVGLLCARSLDVSKRDESQAEDGGRAIAVEARQEMKGREEV